MPHMFFAIPQFQDLDIAISNTFDVARYTNGAQQIQYELLQINNLALFRGLLDFILK